MMPIVDIIGWIGTVTLFGGSLLSIWKHKLCWHLWIIGGICLGYQAYVYGLTNMLLVQILYMPLNVWGLKQWNKDELDREVL